MATISHLVPLLFFTLTLSIHAKLNLDTADHLAMFTILKDLGVAGELHCPESLCNTAGISCEPKISKESYVLKVTGIVLKTQRLRGFLSPAIGQLSELKELSFPNNYLVDRIPPQIANCRKLEILHVRNNKLSGNVPGELSSLIHLRILDLSSNMFSGDLRFLNYFPNLEKLSLDNNMFTGKVPVSIRSFRNLRFCHISGNSFLKGPLPERKKTNYEGVPKRYILAELRNPSSNQNGNENSGSNSPEVAPYPRNNKHRKNDNGKTTLVVILVVGAISATIFLLILLIVFLVIKCIIRWNEPAPTTPTTKTLGKLFLFYLFFEQQTLSRLRPYIKAKELEFLNDDEAIAALQVIGRGGCGEVYKMELPNRYLKTVAIKKIMQPPKDTVMHTEEDTLRANRIQQILSEIETVGKIRHRNLLPLLAYISRPTCYYLVYKFMQNGSLQDVMRQVNDGTRELDWVAMHRIAIGVAHGLEYLHTSITPRIVHLDLKPANILLDDNMEPVITDFGLAKSIPDAWTYMTSSSIVGTLGFIAPEYHETLQFTDKCDIYSYGVLLGFLVIGKLPSDEFFQHTSEMSMVRWMRMLVTSGNPEQAINPNLLGKGYDEEMLLLLDIAVYCVEHDPQERPTSKECRIMLSQLYQ